MNSKFEADYANVRQSFKQYVENLRNSTMKSGEKMVAMWGSASEKTDPRIIEATERLGALMAENGYAVAYGGGATGCMGAIARGIKSKDGTLIGIAPDFMCTHEPTYDECDVTINQITTMAERKFTIQKLSKAFLVCPGGIGTVDEWGETLALKELGILDNDSSRPDSEKDPTPVIFFSPMGYYDPMIEMFKHWQKFGIVRPGFFDLFKICNTPEEVIEALNETISEKNKNKTDRNDRV